MGRSRVSICAAVVAILASLMAAPLASGQVPAPTGTLSGVVVDPVGAVVPEVAIVVIQGATALMRETTTDAKGTFTFPLLPPGTYTLRATRAGFTPFDVPAVLLDVREPVVLRVQLKVDSLTESVVVTAQKRGDERPQDVPIPLAVLNPQRLTSNNLFLLRDYYASVPGLGLSTNFLGQQRLSVRGIATTQGASPTVGIMIDDVPLGGSTGQSGGQYVPDIDPGDLARIEVLRGPQGTLYGANSMGGLIKYVTADPSFEQVSGRVETSGGAVHNGSTPSYNVRASGNVPLSDTLAIRVSGFGRRDAGYIANPVLGLEDVNRADALGARLQALWRVSPVVSLKVAGFYQRTEAKGSSEVETEAGLGDLQQNYLDGTGGYERTVQGYSAVLKARLAGIDLTAISGYTINDIFSILDFSYAVGADIAPIYGVSDATYTVRHPNKRFTQEVRLSGSFRQKVDWLLGAYYTHESSPLVEKIYAGNIGRHTSVGEFYSNETPRVFSEYAAFPTLTYKVTPRFDVQVGGRVSRNQLTVPENVITGPYTTLYLGEPSPFTIQRQESKTSALTYLVTPRFRASADFMLYARLASGYRPGGPNDSAVAVSGLPLQFEPDKTQNYEIGIKGSSFADRLSIDLSLYRIAWRDIQIGLLDPATLFPYTSNGGQARSQGVEIAATVRPPSGLTVSSWVAYNNAVLTETLPANSTAMGASGDRLPDAPRWSGNVSLEQAFPLWSGKKGFIGAAVSYVGDRTGVFMATPRRQALPAYSKVDLHAGIDFDSWTMNVFVTNLTDERGLINGGLGYSTPNAFVYVPPRAVGLSVSRRF